MSTFINSTGLYVPAERVPNSYFARLYDKPQEWFVQRSGIETRSRASEEETLDHMTIKAVEDAMKSAPYPVTEVDLIVHASYSPDDLVGTTAHHVQRHFGISGAKAFYVSSACSSAINAVEIINSFFKSGISRKALLISGDRNSTYSDDNDPSHGHLWGDGAVAYFMSTERFGEGDLEVLDVDTQGLGEVGAGPEGVYLRPRTVGIGMPHGRDVFNQACVWIERFSRRILERNGLSVSDLDWFVSHQANLRIVSHVCRELGLPMDRTLNNIAELGNTGCGSSLLSLAQNRGRLREGDTIVVSTFGGGYSVGAILLKVG